MKKSLFLSCLIASIIVMQACSTTNPYTREQQTSKATKGAAIGAGLGALAGILSGDGSRERKERALKGAGIGAVTGVGVGAYMDVQETKLRQKLDRTGVSVTRDGENIILNMPANITFAVNSTQLRPDFVDVLDSVADVLKEYKSTLIQIGGHTDSTGSDSHNQLLSELRARSVGDQLIKLRVQPARIETIGYGESHPIASNASESGRQQNRRVELYLVPIK
jgi:outer membrane protein OmpA-like peptidoglycan-associated protein